MKKWLVPLTYPLVSIVAYLLLLRLAHWANGDGTGYGGIVVGLYGIIFYFAVVTPAVSLLYSKHCLKGERHCLSFTLYQSFFIAAPFYILFLLSRNAVYIAYVAAIFAWCVLWAAIGLAWLRRNARKAKTGS